jgi:Protein of unknown function (DUF5131)
MGQPNYECGFLVALHERTLELPLGWKKPQVVFVNSMSDLFHDEKPPSSIARRSAQVARPELRRPRASVLGFQSSDERRGGREVGLGSARGAWGIMLHNPRRGRLS